MKTNRCRHYRSWLLTRGRLVIEWCYQCGAFRELKQTGTAECTASSVWCKPTGPGGGNPWTKWTIANGAFDKRRAAKNKP